MCVSYISHTFFVYSMLEIYKNNCFKKMRVLIIEDNDILRGNIKKYLEIKWHTADAHDSFEWATYKIMTGSYDIIILDLWLGSDEWDGLDICREVREKGNTVPVLMLTARTLTPQKIEWLDSGADDYMTKPFDYEELIARLKAMVRRDHSLKWDELVINDLRIKVSEMRVEQNDEEVSLSKLEFNLLLYLVQNSGRVLTKEEITEKVWWEIDMFKESRTLDIYIWYLRKKLWKDVVETVRGVWYMID